MTVPAPSSGTLSGHAAGEPFDKLVYSELKRLYPANAYRQFEYLNKLYLSNLEKAGLDRFNLFDSEVAKFLLKRGEAETRNWSPSNMFEEKQNDTADNLFVNEEGPLNKYDIIDIKTKNESKHAQPPNIISALKLAGACDIMIKNKEYDRVSIHYICIDWKKDNSVLRCTGGQHADLFKSDPTKLYINWAAALQIQFDVHDLPQSYSKDQESWCYQYLAHFVESAERRVQEMEKKMIEPFRKYRIERGLMRFN